jgi:hypothetical protein
LVEIGGTLLMQDSYRNEVPVDLLLNFPVGEDLGFQPSASRSAGRGAEIEHNHFPLRAGQCESGFGI